MKRILMLLSCLLVTAGTAAAGEPREIELTDGSVLSGEVLSLSNGIYTIRTEAMGTVTVRDSSVRAVRSRGAGDPPAPAAGNAGRVRSLQQQMLSDQEILSMIESLQNDPSFKQALEDPEITKAISAGDIGALMTNPKFLQLMNNSTVKGIQRKMDK